WHPQGARYSVVGAELRVRRGSHRAAMIGAWPSTALSAVLATPRGGLALLRGVRRPRRPNSSCCEAPRQAHRRYFRHLQADWSKGPAMVTGELTGRVLALAVSVPCPAFPTTGMPAGLAGARSLPGQPGSRPLYATTRSTSGALSGTGTGGAERGPRGGGAGGG